MRKLKMVLDDLRVDSFATSEAGPARSGTVHGHLDDSRGCVVFTIQTVEYTGICHTVESCAVSCPAGQTCGDTCGLCEAHKPLERA